MQFGYFRGAGYMKQTEYSPIDYSPVELGDKVIVPGMFIEKLGDKAKTAFELQEGYYLRYLGKVENYDSGTYLLFDVNDNEGYGWKYCFGYIDKNMLLNLCAGACYDIRITKLNIVTNPKFHIEPKQLSFL